MGFLVDPDDDFAETNENNNDAITGSTTPVQTPPNLTVEDVTFLPGTVAPGDDLTVEYVRSNTGGATASNFDVDVYLSTNATIGAGDTKLCTVSVPTSPAGDVAPRGVTCPVPPSLALGDYYVGVVIDEPNDVTESDETDNDAVSATRVTIDGDIDLEVLSVNILDTNGFAGGLFDVELEMRNNGTFDSAPFEIGVLFSPDSTVTTADTLACDVPTGASLRAGATLAITLTNCVVPSLPIGDYTVGVWLDSSQTVPESNENNNIRADTNDDFTVKGIDLWVHDIDLPNGTAGAPGDDLYVLYTRENLGNVAAGTFRLSIVLSTDATITTSDTQACYADLSSPAGDQVTTGLTGCTVPSLPPGTYHAGVIIDSLDDVVEVDETNNVGVAPITFTVQ
jgi:subtilase family serine protease